MCSHRSVAGKRMSRFLRLYIVPGAVIQSVMVGGGYGTGREIVEYFTSYGALGGILGLGVAFIVLATVIALTFEFARVFRAYDYRKFCKYLLGPGWVIYEVLIILLFLLVLAVLASAAGNILRDNFGIPYGAGLVVMLGVVGVLTFFGRALVAAALTFWSFFLYVVFIVFLVAVFSSDQFSLTSTLGAGDVVSGWWLSGLQYAAYNVAGIPLLLYVARNFETRNEAVLSGISASVMALVPALIFQLAFVAASPDVLSEAIPVYWMISQLGMTAFLMIYTVMLFGTFIETGAGILQGINERIDGYLAETSGSSLSPVNRSAIAVFAILVSAGLSFIGITDLIARGYGTLAWGFLVVYVIPLMTIGVVKLSGAYRARS
jgi:uncharacterized membrane protein YkvI